MKKLIISVLVALMLGTPSYCEVVRKGNNFTQVASTRSKKNLVLTKYTYTTKSGETYPIYIDTNSGACYLKRVSKKTGNAYEQKLDEETSKAIAKELGIEYTWKPRNKK